MPTHVNGQISCSVCGALNVPAARFCRQCGRAFGASTTQTQTQIIAVPRPPTALPATQIRSMGPPTLTFAPPLPSAGQRELTVVVQDVSGSMNDKYDAMLNKLEAAKRAACSMILQKGQVDGQDEIAVVAFDDTAQAVCRLLPIATERQQIITAVQGLTIAGGTDINEGLKAAREILDWNRRDVVRRIILQTDGHGGHPLHTAADLKKRGVVIDVVGVGASPDGVDERLLKKVASVIQGEVRYRFIKDSQTLVKHYTQLATKTKTA